MKTTSPIEPSHLKISDNLIHAWRLMKGSKTALWAAFLAWIAIVVVILLLARLISLFLSIPPNIASHPLTLLGLTWAIIAITAPIFAGMNMIAIKRARGEFVSVRTGFQYFAQWRPLASAFILIAVISTLSILASIVIRNYLIIPFLPASTFNHWLPTFILTIADALLVNLTYALLIFVVPLISDKQLSVFKAIRQSLCVAKAHWPKLFVLLMVFYLLNLLNLLTLEIPYIGLICYIIASIWLVPFIFLNVGVAYHQLVDNKIIRRNKHANAERALLPETR